MIPTPPPAQGQVCPHCGTAHAMYVSALNTVVTCRDVLAAQVRERDERMAAMDAEFDDINEALDDAIIDREECCVALAPLDRVRLLVQERDRLKDRLAAAERVVEKATAFVLHQDRNRHLAANGVVPLFAVGDYEELRKELALPARTVEKP